MNISRLSISLVVFTLITITSSPVNSYSLDFFKVNGDTYELDEVDIGRKLGCDPGGITAVVLRNSSTHEELWSYPSTDEIKRRHLIKKKECFAHGAQQVDVINVLSLFSETQFTITSQSCGASCSPITASIYSFDGEKVQPVFDLTEYGLRISFYPPIFTAIYEKQDGECHACPKRWIKEEYKWNGSSYQKVKSEVSKTKSDRPPW